MARVVLLGDLVDSRKLPRRREWAGRIESALREAGQRWEWHAPPAASKGIDEFSSVLAHASDLFDVCVWINETLHSVSFRFAGARGAVDVHTGSSNANQMDGPAFHLASMAVDRARREGRVLALVDEEAPDHQELGVIEALARCHQSLMEQLTAKQRNAWVRLRKLGTQEAVADELSKTQQNVSKLLRRAAASTLLETEGVIRQWLGRRWERRS